ncbi:MAG: hypothetical protein V8S57_08130 [Oscillospiraceae bacterium]
MSISTDLTRLQSAKAATKTAMQNKWQRAAALSACATRTKPTRPRR